LILSPGCRNNRNNYIMKKYFNLMKGYAYAILVSLVFVFAPLSQATDFYLHDTPNEACDGYSMDSSSPSSFIPSYAKLEEGAAVWCTKPFQSDAGIKGDVRATLYVEASFIMPEMLPFQLRFIKVSLLDVYNGNSDVIGSSRVTPIIYFSNETVKTKTFVISNVDYVIPAGHSLGIKVEKVVDLLSYFPFSVLAPFFSTNVLFDSVDAPSFVEVPLNISGGGIYIQCYGNTEKVKPGEKADYGLIIYNNGSQKQQVKLSSNYSGNKWKIDMPDVVEIDGNSFKYVDIQITAPSDAKPGDYLNVTITASSESGSYSIWLNTTVIPFKHGVSVVAKNSPTAEPGDKVNLTFEIKNTGDLEDTYSLSVKSSWEYELPIKQITLNKGQSKNVNVYVKVPLNALNGTKEGITLYAKSTEYGEEGNATAYITVIYYAVPPSPNEKMKIVGYILFVLGVIALLAIAAYLGKVSKKTVAIESEERVAEITPGKEAVFTVKVKNPMEKLKSGKNKIKYKIGIEGKLPEKWVAKLDREQLVLDGGEEAEIKLIVNVPKDAPIEEWASIDVVVSPNVGKSEHINFLITLREPKPLLKMEYEHEGEMREGNKVVTKIKVKNEGEADAINKSIVVLVNGKEKNRIDGLNIPAGGEVEIEIPWIAEEENEVEVKIF